jgi:hypothetical protein
MVAVYTKESTFRLLLCDKGGSLRLVSECVQVQLATPAFYNTGRESIVGLASRHHCRASGFPLSHIGSTESTDIDGWVPAVLVNAHEKSQHAEPLKSCFF